MTEEHMIIVNFKAYSEATGKKAREIAEACEKAHQETGEKIIITPSHLDLLRTEHLNVETFTQHLDPEEPGSHTGSITAEAAEQAGATGTLLNHSENRINKEKIEASVQKAREKDLTTVVCAQNPEECRELSKLGPDYIAYEPPELIGGDTSVSESKPELIEEAVNESEVPVLTGAGIKDTEDVEKSIEHGCKGVLVASGVIKNEKPHDELVELAEGL